MEQMKQSQNSNIASSPNTEVVKEQRKSNKKDMIILYDEDNDLDHKANEEKVNKATNTTNKHNEIDIDIESQLQ